LNKIKDNIVIEQEEYDFIKKKKFELKDQVFFDSLLEFDFKIQKKVCL